MANLKEETLRVLKNHGKTEKDIQWIGTSTYKIPIELFWTLSNRYYNEGYGTAIVASDLLIVGDDWFLERAEYDGAEWWEFKTIIEEPKKTKEVRTLFGGGTLDEINKRR